MVEQLRKDTLSDHEKLEDLMFAQSIMNGTLSFQHYKTLLTTNYLVHEEYETLLFNRLTYQAASDLQITRRHKLLALMKDLEEAQMDIPKPADMISSDAYYNNEPSVLGALYVLEGATLGGHVIVKKLAGIPVLNRLNLNFNYYRIYGDDLIPNWKSFCVVLNRQSDIDYPSILDGARRMFRHYYKTFDRGSI
jgi:heme oxygenase (biliverdin-IX-beta and delta-forming)